MDGTWSGATRVLRSWAGSSFGFGPNRDKTRFGQFLADSSAGKNELFAQVEMYQTFEDVTFMDLDLVKVSSKG